MVAYRYQRGVWHTKGAYCVAEPSLELIRRAQRGERDALEQLVISQKQYIYSIAMTIFHNTDDAEDLTQTAFIRLFRSIHQYNGDSKFTTWLYRLVINLGRDELRSRRRKVPIINPIATDDDELDPVTLISDTNSERDPQASLEHNETRRILVEALAQLDDQYRLTLTMLYFDDMKYADIADILEIPLNTVKSHIRRGKERLREILEGQHIDERGD
jgi:RNA polymerase sigma-70 factor, ECF subfamily